MRTRITLEYHGSAGWHVVRDTPDGYKMRPVWSGDLDDLGEVLILLARWYGYSLDELAERLDSGEGERVMARVPCTGS